MKEICTVRLLGFVQVRYKGTLIQDFVSRKAVALLGYMLVKQEPVPRSHLVDLFWPGKTEKRGRANLSLTLNNLTTLLPDCFQNDYYAVHFEPAHSYWLDISTFEALTSQGGIEDLASAAALYRDEFMAGLDLKDCPDFETWLATERVRWHQRQILALQKLITHYMDSHNLENALDYTSRLLALDPLHEEGQRQMMLLLARSGQRSAAMAQYQAFRRQLQKELNIEPGSKTKMLYEKIRTMERTPMINLPVQPTPFVGRQAELAAIQKCLRNPDCRLLTLVGPGGIGKTRLAIQSAEQFAQDGVMKFLHGIHYVALSSVGSTDVLPTTIAGALNISLAGPKEHGRQLIDLLRRQEMLIILDNFEHLLAAASFLVDLLQQAPAVKLLVTSRTALKLRWERVMEVGGLDYPPDSAELGQGQNPDTTLPQNFSAVRLFTQAAQRRRPTFSLNGNVGWVRRICELVEGMPLGLELAAVWLHIYSGETIAKELERSLDFLSTTSPDVPERHQSIRAVFEYSWAFLSEAEKKLFKELSIFTGSITLDAANAVAAASPTALSALIDNAFLKAVREGRYSIHELLRQYGLEKLKQDPEMYTATVHRYCDYYATFLRERYLPQGGNQKENLLAISREIDDIRAALSLAADSGEIELLYITARGLFWFYELRGWFREAVAIFKDAKEKLRQRNAAAPSGAAVAAERLAGRLLVLEAYFTTRLGDYRLAYSALEQALALLRRFDNNDSEDLAFALVQLGMICRFFGKYTEARQYLGECLMISRQFGYASNISFALIHLGLTACDLGDYKEAKKHYDEGLKHVQQMNDVVGIGVFLICLGEIFLMQQDYSEARHIAIRGVKICRDIGYSFGVGLGLTVLGRALWLMGDAKQGKQHCQEALDIFIKTGERFGQVMVQNRLGYMAWAERESEKAYQIFTETLQIALELSLTPWALEALVGITMMLIKQGEQIKATQLLAYIVHHSATMQDTKDKAECLLIDLRAQLPKASAIITAQASASQNKDLEEMIEAILGTGRAGFAEGAIPP